MNIHVFKPFYSSKIQCEPGGPVVLSHTGKLPSYALSYYYTAGPRSREMGSRISFFNHVIHALSHDNLSRDWSRGTAYCSRQGYSSTTIKISKFIQFNEYTKYSMLWMLQTLNFMCSQCFAEDGVCSRNTGVTARIGSPHGASSLKCHASRIKI